MYVKYVAHACLLVATSYNIKNLWIKACWNIRYAMVFHHD